MAVMDFLCNEWSQSRPRRDSAVIPEKPLINNLDGIVRFNQHGLSGSLPQALIIIC